MFDQRRILTLMKQVALAFVALLLVVAGTSSGRASEGGSRIGVEVLRQAIGFQTQSLRRPTNAQTRTSKLKQSDPESNHSTTHLFDCTAQLCLHARGELIPCPTYRLIATPSSTEAVVTRLRCELDVARARAPPRYQSELNAQHT